MYSNIEDKDFFELQKVNKNKGLCPKTARRHHLHTITVFGKELAGSFPLCF
jgi:hypothetical protein